MESYLSELLLKGGIAALENGLEFADIRVKDGVIQEIGSNLEPKDPPVREVDCKDLYVLPGLIDMHVHVDDVIGPFALADTWKTASAAAIATGITTLIGFSTQAPNQTVIQSVEKTLQKAMGASYCDYHLHITPTRWDNATWAELDLLKQKGLKTIKLYTTYREQGLLSTYSQIRNIMNVSGNNGYTILLHCEDDEILAKAKHDNRARGADPATHAKNRPGEAEICAIEKALSICQETMAPLHIVHVSTSKGALLIRAAASRYPVTSETCIQYIALTEKKLAEQNGHRFLCSPPLRREKNRAELLQHVKNGNIDVLATDHCAFLKADKDRGASESIDKVPNGLSGVGSLSPLARELLIDNPADTLSLFVNMLATNPAKICGLFPKKGVLRVGSDADIVVADMFARPKNVHSSLCDAYEPYAHGLSRFAAQKVYLRGVLVAESSSLTDADHPKGRLSCQK